jgi:uncharacterized phage protein (TIGR02220 family)
MPNRVIRDWTASEVVDKLSADSERFFTRLIMKADDMGSYHANLKLLRSALYPLKTNIKESDVSKWLNECLKSGLLILYSVDGKNYLRILNFGQRLRNMRNKFPEPSESDFAATRGNSRPESETETETESETNPKQESESENAAEAGFDLFLREFNHITGRAFKGGKKEKGFLRARIADGYSQEQISRAVENCFNDPFHRENPNYLTPEFILRPDKLEKYLNYITPINNGTKSKFTTKADSVSRANADQLDRILKGDL